MSIVQRAYDEGWIQKRVGNGAVWVRRPMRHGRRKDRNVSKYRARQRHPAEEGSVGGVVSDPVFASSSPALFDFVCVRPDGAPPGFQMSALTVFSEDGLIKLALNDRENDVVCFYSAPTLQEALEGLEDKLSSGEVDWKRSKPKGRKK